jgi:hypothetical protein
MENEIPQTTTVSKRKTRILQSTWARMRRKVSKYASKKQRQKEARELQARYNGKQQQISKENRIED